APKPAELDVLKVADKYEIAFDTSQTPELKEWVEKKLKPTCATWYPKIVELLPSEGVTAPRRFTIVFHKDMRGVANTGGRQINCAGPWFLKNLEGEAVGAVVHEMVHVVQQYGRSRGGGRSPGWMVEGVADYVRWFLYEPEDKRPRPNPARARYTDSYRTTAAFLNYVVDKHDKELIKKFNAAMRQGNYSDDKWKEYTGKTLDELWADYIETLKK
ncbi:MAG: basic secretory protein-like protein, partial [Pirellulales bacterium]